MADVGCKFALNEMRRYGAFQSEVNSFPTINCIPPPTHGCLPVTSSSLFLPRSRSFDAVSCLSFLFEPFTHTHTHPPSLSLSLYLRVYPSSPPRVTSYLPISSLLIIYVPKVAKQLTLVPSRRSTIPHLLKSRRDRSSFLRRFLSTRRPSRTSIEPRARGIFTGDSRKRRSQFDVERKVQESRAASRCKRRCLPRGRSQ